ncbi:MAG TPA: hypothetical protein PK467_18735, partial [Candidatus Wallbacteria bacterium]|nr:hypothetical protein [Candidatus Wallbacteria bacterium]
KSASALTVTAVASPPPVAPATAILTTTAAADLFAFNLKADVSENVKLTKLNITYDGLSNNFDANSIKVTFGAPLNKSYTSTNITFSNNIFTLAIP